MRILFEQYRYPLKSVDGDRWDGVSADPDGFVTFDYVGYFFNEKNGHCVLILPRVMLEDIEIDGKTEERVFVERKGDVISFTGFRPEDIIDPDGRKADGTPLLNTEQRKFIREFAVWIYRAIDLYWKGICKDESDDGKRKRRGIHRKLVPVMGRGSLRKSHTLLDVILAMREYRKDNDDFFLRVLRERTSGVNKINWTKTVARSSMVMTESGPLYANPFNRRSEINLDEELFVIFYSVLAYIHKEYGFEKSENPGFSTLTPVQFGRYLNGYGIVRLKQIRHKYFSDRALRMWDLCYSFFEHHHEIRVNGSHQEYLLAKDFQIVFEAMIDELIGDKNLPDGLKEQEDGKRVDHMYRFHSLEDVDDVADEDRKIFYIGDSKYYKRRNRIGDHSVYKQFTYARNVVQWNLDLFLDNRVADNVDVFDGVRRLRNEATEGYAVIPNFFISARIDDDLRYDHREITPTEKEKKDYFARQFENRLFDRDTFLIAHYDVNFLYVLSLYARNNTSKRNEWKNYVRNEFRRRIREMLQENFEFYVMTPKSDTNAAEFFRDNFRDVIGKVFDPYGDRGDGFEYYSLALRRTESKSNLDENNKPILDFDKDNARIRDLLGRGFYISEMPITLGDRPEDKVTGEPRNPHIVMPSYNFEKAVKELSNGVYSDYLDPAHINLLKKAMAFPLPAGIRVKDHPENVHTVFLYNSGGDNKLTAVIQVVFVDSPIVDFTSLLSYRQDGMTCSELAGFKSILEPYSPIWLWQIIKWVDVK